MLVAISVSAKWCNIIPMIRRWLPAALIGWLATRTAAAQTRVIPSQTGMAPSSTPRFTAYLANGSPIAVVFDPATMALDTSTIPATLRARVAAAAPTVPEVEITEPTGPVTGITLLQSPGDKPLVFVNGLLYGSPKDYTISGRQITLKVSVGAGDTVQVIYHK